MFLRRHRRTKNGKTHIYYALVESVRTEAGPRQRVVAHLGELNHEQERRWQRTVRFHNQQGEDRQLRLFPDDNQVSSPSDPDIVRIDLKSVGWANPRQFGDVWLGALALETSEARRDSRLACSSRQGNDPPRRHRGYRGDQPFVLTLLGICAGRALVCVDWPGGPSGYSR